MVVEKLLQFLDKSFGIRLLKKIIKDVNLIAKVDTELLKAIELKNLEACNVQDPDEHGLLHGVIH